MSSALSEVSVFTVLVYWPDGASILGPQLAAEKLLQVAYCV